MIELNLNLEEIGISKDSKGLEIEVIPQPEVLIDSKEDFGNWRNKV